MMKQKTVPVFHNQQEEHRVAEESGGGERDKGDKGDGGWGYVGGVCCKEMMVLLHKIKGWIRKGKEVTKIADRRCSVVLVVFIVALYSTSPQVYLWMMKTRLGDILQSTFSVLDSFDGLNSIVAMLLLCLGVWWAKRIARDKDVRWHRPLVVALGFELLFAHNPLRFVTIIEWFDYRGLCALILLGISLVMVVKVIKHRKRPKPSEHRNGFSNDDIDTGKVSEEMRQYADSIIGHLLNTDMRKHSFAVGITGEWGGGKTTFLDLLGEKLWMKAEVVRFNPWMCRTPEQVTEDFFVTMRQQLAKRHSSLSHPISDYAKYLSSATFSLGNGIVSKLALNIPNESLQSKKDQLSDKLRRLNSPVVVLIDDLDRLEMDEVFEVLRLIRNTADLSNVAFIVAFDKDYVTRVLQEKKIENAAAYLEKIFPVEIHQPKVDEDMLYKVLYEEMARSSEYGVKFARKLHSVLEEREKMLLLDILNNYRRVKRFARQYVLIVDYLKENNIRDIKLKDLMWLELLQMYDKRIYDLLKDEPLTLLYEHGEQYVLRPKIFKNEYVRSDDEMFAYKGEEIWKPKTPTLLYVLFKNDDHVTQLSARYTENLNKYFTLSVSKLRLSVKEFGELFKLDKSVGDVAKEWVNSGKYFSSCLYQFKSCEKKRLSKANFRRYVVGLMEYTYWALSAGGSIEHKAKALLYAHNFTKERGELARGYVLAWAYEKIGEDGVNYVVLSRLLKRLYQTTEYDTANDKTSELESLVITNGDVKALLKDLIGAYIEKKSELSASSVLQEKTEFGKVFGNCTVCTLAGTETDEFDLYENVAFPVVVRYFSQKKGKPTMAEYEKMYGDMFLSERRSYPEGYEDYAAEDYSHQLDAYFGTDNYWLEKLKKECFV